MCAIRILFPYGAVLRPTLVDFGINKLPFKVEASFPELYLPPTREEFFPKSRPPQQSGSEIQTSFDFPTWDGRGNLLLAKERKKIIFFLLLKRYGIAFLSFFFFAFPSPPSL